jgi:hypothetical protein
MTTEKIEIDQIKMGPLSVHIEAATIDDLLSAPCGFCGYNGPGYWQPHTHAAACPFYEVGGKMEREEFFVELVRKKMFHLQCRTEQQLSEACTKILS